MMIRKMFTIKGIVQGVGFRPYCFGLAQKYELTGFVLNIGADVLMEIQGEKTAVHQFGADLKPYAPPLAKIDRINAQFLPIQEEGGFQIRASQASNRSDPLISPDVAVCDDCLRELLDPKDRRYRHPFINCTHCGPRLTIIEAVPYDRINTSMRHFPMCDDCRREYEDPTNRRFHAQPIACPKCGPRLKLDPADTELAKSDPLSAAIDRIKAGRIVAIKGLGGYHLCANALNAQAVNRLRERKNREEKPFALMAKDCQTVAKYCRLNAAEERLLMSRERPIVLLQKSAAAALPDTISPGLDTLGFMLPCTPLHVLLFAETGLDVLIMTSGNISDDPMIYQDEDSLDKLLSIADDVLSHDREILVRCDDSIVMGRPQFQFVRKSRGYIPHVLPLRQMSRQTILGVGAELKNSFCLVYGKSALLSPYIGDLKNWATYQSFRQMLERFISFYGRAPEWIAHDLHPNYLSTIYALESGLICEGVQHHKAHIASVVGENQYQGEVIGVCLDGTGFGEDGTVWGGEFFVGPASKLQRVGRFKPVVQAGGDKAAQDIWRMGLAYLHCAGIHPAAFFTGIAEEDKAIVARMIQTGFNGMLTSSCGRLFDAVAAILGLRTSVAYEAQAAMLLESLANAYETGDYAFDLEMVDNLIQVSFAETIRQIVADLNKTTKSNIAAKFHNTLALAIATAVQRIFRQTGIATVALSGGCFQNRHLLTRLLALLSKNYKVLTHYHLPANDGGIAFGQVMVARDKIY